MTPEIHSAFPKVLRDQHQRRIQEQGFICNSLWKMRRPFGRMVLYGPAVFNNPYQTLLYSAFSARVAVAPLLRAPLYAAARISRIYHLHWDEYLLRERSNQGIPKYIENIIAFRKKNGRLIWTLHNAEPHGSLDAEGTKALHFGRRIICEQADIIHVHNAWAKDYVLSMYNAEESKIHIIPHPSYDGWYMNEAPHGGTINRLHLFLAFGIFRGNKGLDTIIDGVRRAASEIDIGKLVVAGSGSDWVKHISIPRATVEVSSGFISDEKVPDFFNAAEFCIFGFTQITTSGSVMLALSFGCIPILPDLPALRADLPEELFLLSFPPGDADGLAQALINAVKLSSDEISRLRRIALEVASVRQPLRISRILENKVQELLY